ncbi:hypothetical protein [Sunxiuqinia indica]|uniref:hypothetical protein n=1 Tax=Sunxiuqinia indica TaxID=2692584 RepID=UPI0013578FEB|nr:hypothetical protein [Sunxiuqinia indica]
MISRIILAGLLLIALTSCSDDEDDGIGQVELSYSFNAGAEGWVGGFADYPVGEEEAYELTFDEAMLPAPLDETEGAIKLSGTNMSDDLFMYMKTGVSDLEPNTTYYVSFTVEFASNVPDDQVGVGGSPGESVYIKAGATTTEPLPEEDNMGYYRMNIDKGNQSQGGMDMLVLGDFSNDTDQEVYTLKTVSNSEPFTVTSDADGNVWLIVGTDSGFEATTTIYYNELRVVFDAL